MITTATPARTIEQRMEALQKANMIRVRRAQLKRDIKARRVDLREVLAQPPEWVATAKVIDLVLAAPRYGRVKANGVLHRCQISPSKTVGGLSPRQREEILRMLHA